MNDKLNRVNPTPAGTDPAKPAVTAEDVVAQLRAIRDQIPEYAPLPRATTRSLIPVASLDREFVMTSIHMTGASDRVEEYVGASSDELLQTTVEHDQWSGVEEELRAMLKGVSAANLSRRYRLGSAALRAYTIGRALAKRPEHANLVPHVEEMKRLIRLARRKAAEPPPNPA